MLPFCYQLPTVLPIVCIKWRCCYRYSLEHHVVPMKMRRKLAFKSVVGRNVVVAEMFDVCGVVVARELFGISLCFDA